MLITVQDLEREPVQFDTSIVPEAVDYGFDIQQIGALNVAGRADLIIEHRGPRNLIHDIRVRGGYKGNFEILCARCLEPVEHPLNAHFDLIFRPIGADSGSSEHAVTPSETEIGYYQGEGLLLEDVLREQVLLSLPAKTLCRQDCKGLCPHCGRNLNSETCACEETVSDPRWSALSDLRSRMKH